MLQTLRGAIILFAKGKGLRFHVKIPNCQNAEVPMSKVVDYLLCIGHPEGGPKARFFFRWGFTLGEWNVLSSALIKQVKENDYTEAAEGKYGTKYVVVAPIESPKGATSAVKSIWMVADGSDHPRLISSYPVFSDT